MEAQLKDLIDKMIELSDYQDELEGAKEELDRLEKAEVKDNDAIGRQKSYIKEIENRIKPIQDEIQKKIDDYKKEIDEQEKYWTEQVNDLEEEVKNAEDEQMKETYQQALDEAKVSLEDAKKQKEKAAKYNLEDIMAKVSVSKELIKTLKEEKDRLKKSAKDYDDILNDVVNPDVSKEQAKSKVAQIINNRKRAQQKINVGGYEMTRQQAEEELETLKARLEHEEDLDNIDDPDYNRQAILDRIAEIQKALGIEDEREPHPEPPQPPRGPGEPGPGEPGPGEPGELADVNSGLQQLRKQMNYIRDNYPIENKHTLTERMALPQALAGLGGAALIGLTSLNPLIGMGVIGASIASRPIAYRLTGQKALEDKIVSQLRDMALNDKENFNLMVDYLSEEKVQDIKPNAVFLRALHKVMVEETKDAKKELSERMGRLKNEQSEIMKIRENRELTQEEKDRLKEINDGIAKIEKDEAPDVQRRLKEIRRGKDRVSQRYKGNLATRFNIFAHRNTNSKEYDKPINELADAEVVKLVGERDGNDELIAGGSMAMDKVAKKYTSRGFLGVQNSVFNVENPNNPVKLISDVKDNTIKFITTLGTLGIGLTSTIMKLREFDAAQKINAAEHTRVVNDANKQGKVIQDAQKEVADFKSHGLQKDTIQKAADGKTTEYSAYSEMSNFRKDGGEFKSDYFKRDQDTQDEISNMMRNSDVGNGDTASQLDKLAQFARRLAHGGAKDYGDSLKNKSTVLDHSEQADLIKDAESQKLAEAEIFEKLAEAFRRFDKLDVILKGAPTTFANNFQMVKQSFIGPIVTAMGAAFGVGNDVKRNNDEKLPKGLGNDR